MKNEFQKRDNVYSVRGLNEKCIIDSNIINFGLGDLKEDEIGLLPVTGYQLAVIRWSLLEFWKICNDDPEIQKHVFDGLKDTIDRLGEAVRKGPLVTEDWLDESLRKMEARKAFQNELKALYLARKEEWE
jgi:hypothetical protein